MHADYKDITYDSSILYRGVRWNLNTKQNGFVNTRGLRVRSVQRCIDLQLHMLKKFKHVLEVRLESHSTLYTSKNNIEWLKTRDKFLERVQYKFGDALMAWFRERGDESDFPHYHAVIWLNANDVPSSKPIQAIWEDIHYHRDHLVPFDWEKSQFIQDAVLKGMPKPVTDYAYRWSYICKVATKSDCTGGYDFGCSQLPNRSSQDRAIDVNSSGSMHAV